MPIKKPLQDEGVFYNLIFKEFQLTFLMLSSGWETRIRNSCRWTISQKQVSIIHIFFSGSSKNLNRENSWWINTFICMSMEGSPKPIHST